MTQSASSKRILLIDDEKDVHLFLGDFLAGEGYEVRSAYGWREAISVLAQYEPNLIILDVRMPEIDGNLITETLKKEMASPIPILIYSAYHSTADIVKSFSKGCNAFIGKPGTLSELRDTVHYLLQERPSAAPAS